MASGGLDHGRRRDIGEAAAQHEMIGIGSFDGGDRQREIAIRHQPGEGLAVGERPGRIATIGLVLARVALIKRISSVGRLDARQRVQRVPGLRRRAPDALNSENRDSARAASECGDAAGRGGDSREIASAIRPDRANPRPSAIHCR